MSIPPDINDSLIDSANKAANGSSIIHRVGNDPEGSFIETLSGPTPSIKEWFSQKAIAIDAEVAEKIESVTEQAVAAEASALAAEAARDAMLSAVAMGAAIGRATLALLNADLAHDINTLAIVTNDPTTTNNKTYIKLGASGAGSWAPSSSPSLASVDQRTGVLEAKAPANIPASDIAEDIVWGVSDQSGKVALGVTATGRIVGSLGNMDDRTASLELAAPVPFPAASAIDGDIVWCISDQVGNIALGVTASGRIVGSIAADSAPPDSASTGSVSPVPYPLSTAQSEIELDIDLAICDSSGRVILAYNDKGVLIVGAPAAIPDPRMAPVTYIKALPTLSAFVIDGSKPEKQVTFNGDVYGPQVLRTKSGYAVKYVTVGINGKARPWLSALDGSLALPGNSDMLFHILCTGQSLSAGVLPVETKKIRFHNSALMLNHGTNCSSSGATFGAVTALDPGAVTSFVDAFPMQNFGEMNAETIAHGLMDGVNSDALAKLGTNFRMLYSGHGRSGWPYALLKKGTVPYSNGLIQVDRARSIAQAAGMDYACNVICNVHGESDVMLADGLYRGYVNEWINDYNTDIKAITGQTSDVVMFLCQMHSWPKMSASLGTPVTTSFVPTDQLKAHIDFPRVVLVTPKYFLTYSADGIHPADGKQIFKLGEYYAKAMTAYVTTGVWEPVRPKTITRTGANIDIEFYVPAGPLVLDTVLVSNPGNYGFEYKDDTDSATISSITVLNATTVRVALNQAPTGTNKRVRYAYTAVLNANAGPTTGPRGCLRDSDPKPSMLDGLPLYNWAVTFSEPIN